MEHFTITIPEDAWEPTGTDEPGESSIDDRLLATITINGTPMHLEAVAVHEDKKTGELTADDFSFQDNLDTLGQADGQAGVFTTTTIKGREYVLWAVPYSR